MDIDLLSELLRDLIIENDRVGLPGMGDFAAEVVPATFSDKGYTINPPYRKIFFRKGKCSNNLLAEHYAKSCNLSLEDAEKTIFSFVSEMESVLMERKVIMFPGLGRLRATKENHIFFVAEEGMSVHPSDIALKPVSLKSKGEVIPPSEEDSDLSISESEQPQVEESAPETPTSKNLHKKGIPPTLIICAVSIAVASVLIIWILLTFFPESPITEWLLYDNEQIRIIHQFNNLPK